MTAEQKARDMLYRMGFEDAQNMSSGELVELANLISWHSACNAKVAALSSALREARRFVELAGDDAESNHDDPDGDLYMDYGQYAIMTETKKLLENIDFLIDGKEAQ